MSESIGSLQFPPVTRALLIATVAVTGGILTNVVPYHMVALYWRSVLKDYQVWRPFTSFFFGGNGISLLFNLFMLFRTSSALEEATYLNDTAAYSWSLLVMSSIILAATSVIPLFQAVFNFRALFSALIYLWCKENPTNQISIFGLVSVPSRLYPLVLIVLDFIQHGPGAALQSLLGILTAHFWWFISVYLPVHAPARLRRPNPLSTPAWYRRQFVPVQGAVRRSGGAGGSSGSQTSNGPSNGSGSSTARSSNVARGVSATNYGRSSAAEAVRHRWGSGQKLGSE